MERLHLLGLPSIELRRLHIDFGTTNIVWTSLSLQSVLSVSGTVYLILLILHLSFLLKELYR